MSTCVSTAICSAARRERRPKPDSSSRARASRRCSPTWLGGDAIAALGQAANDAAFDRTVDMVAVMATEPDLRARMRARIEPLVGEETRVIVAHSLGTVLSYMVRCGVSRA